MRALLIAAVVLLAGCSADIDVATEPISETVPVTSIAEPVYAEVAIDIPDEVQGETQFVTVDSIAADLAVVNPLEATTLSLGMRLSFTGQATPDQPAVYTDLNRPAYFDASIPLIPATPFAPSTTTPVHIADPALEQVVHYSRVYLIVSNSVTSLVGLQDTLPFDVQLDDIVLRATVTKDFSGMQGGTALGGL